MDKLEENNVNDDFYKERNQWTNPPGTYFDFLASPIDDPNVCVEVAILNEHRFAFYYWLKWTNYYKKLNKTIQPRSLVTIDWHNDLHKPDNFLKKHLDSLDIKDLEAVSYTSWSKLNPLNDDHILSSLYLNLLKDVFVLSKQPITEELKNELSYQDKYGNSHKIFLYKTIDQVIERLNNLNEELYLDIDLDYFIFSNDPCGDNGILVPEIEIDDFLNPNNAFFKLVFKNLKGFTIAKEPKWCNGLKNSNFLVEKINNNLFNNTLLTKHAKWRN